MFSRFRSYAIAFFIVGAIVETTTAATLRNAVSVDRDVIRLSDLFIDAGKHSKTVIANAPAPGRSETFGARQLQNIARRAGLDWYPESRYDRTVVRRPGDLIATDEIISRLEKTLRQSGLPKSQRIKLSKKDLSIYVARGAQSDIRISSPKFNIKTGTFSAAIEIPRGKRGIERLQVTGRTFSVVNVPVFARRLQRNDIIRKADLDFIELPQSAVGRNALLDTRDIVGKTPKRLIQTGKQIRNGDLKPPTVVKKGSLVTIVLRTKKMLITARGRAIDDGAKGEVVRVQNTRSRKTIEATVAGPSRVTIGLLGGIL
ncbi:MAG: flagellar basal body P-ring formation protein FlgA [Alphaproteobacteria bacterium]|nr:flagellar basal body P-ring formation protein FlgA [Alphaproteobacteria bacterium]